MSATSDENSTETAPAAMPLPLDLAGEDGTGIPTRLLILGLTSRRGHLALPEVLRVGEACGLGPEKIRSCVRRLVAEGLYLKADDDQEHDYVVTALGDTVIRSTLERSLLAYAQDAAGRGWDRTWHFVSFAISETERAARDQLRDHVRRLGGAQIHKGLYVSPHRWEDDIMAEVDRLGVVDSVALSSGDFFRLHGEENPRRIAGALWPLDQLAERYRAFIAQYEMVPHFLEHLLHGQSRLTEDDWLPGVLHIAVRFADCFNLDPLLPPELLPRPWPGRQARELLARCRKMGVLTRADHRAPAFFWIFDDAIAHLP